MVPEYKAPAQVMCKPRASADLLPSGRPGSPALVTPAAARVVHASAVAALDATSAWLRRLTLAGAAAAVAEMLQQGWHPHAGMSPGQTSTYMLSSGTAVHCFTGRWTSSTPEIRRDRRVTALPHSTCCNAKAHPADAQCARATQGRGDLLRRVGLTAVPS
jgi:hypothetical protein